MKILSILSCLAVLAFQKSPALSNTPFTVAVLQASGALIPFATYNGTKWMNSWPESGGRNIASVEALAKVPPAWTSGVPLPENWRLWLSTDTSYHLKMLGPAYVKSECGDHWSLTVDFPKQATGCSNCCPVPTIGIALSTDRPLMPMTETEVTGAVRTTLQSAFNQLETREISKIAAQYGAPGGRLSHTGHSTDAAVRNSKPIVVQNAWRGDALISGFESLYYIEATREYTKPADFNDSGCPGISAFRGWIQTNLAGKTSVISQRLVTEDCDMKTAGFTTPMGLIEINGVNHAIVQMNGWESQEFGILKIETNAVNPLVITNMR
jgi:hypothetical protein